MAAVAAVAALSGLGGLAWRRRQEVLEVAPELRTPALYLPLALYHPALIGLAQRVDHKAMGRFELGTSENFNRHYPDLAQAIWPTVQAKLGANAQANVATVRAAIGDYLRNSVPTTELDSLRHTLLSLAFDADTMLDLHCDCEAVMHFYTEESCWPQLEPLTRLLQCQTVLLAKNSGSGPIDECLSGVWWRLADRLAITGNPAPVSYTHLRAHETVLDLVCRLLLEKKKHQ